MSRERINMTFKVNMDTLTLPVPYTLEMLGTGTFVATWSPVVPTPDLPNRLVGRSASSGVKAIRRLYGQLVSSGVVPAPEIKASHDV